jgi:VWFA-related protein
MRVRSITLTLTAATLALPLHAQTIGQNKAPGAQDTYTLSVRSQLVVESVTVKDKQGNPVQGLTAADFILTEDGVPQKIRFCEHQTLPTSVVPLAKPSPDEENLKLYKRLTRTQISPEVSENVKYKDRRLLALYFDMSAMRPAEQFRALAAAEKFIRTQMTPLDLIAIMRYQGGSVDVLQDFSSDRNRLLSILQTLVVGEGQGSAESVDDASSADVGAAFGQDDSEFNVFNTDRQLSALQTAARMLGELNEKKSLIYFASGLRLNGTNNQAQLHATVDAAIRAGVSFWPIDARGLVAEAPLGDATKGSPGNQDTYSGVAAQANTNNFQQSQDTLYSLAGDTGGKALLDYNDLDRGIVNAQQAISDYYILEYYTTNPALDGRFRRIKVTVNHPADAKLDFRQGYFAGKDFSRFNVADKERQLEDALMLGDPITELTIAMEINYFQLNRAEYFVPIVVKIPGRELALAKRGGADHTLIDFVGEIKDIYGGNTVSNVRDNVNIKLTDATAAELAHRPIEYDAGFTLLPGKYMIKFLARDDETGRIGTYQTNFTVPNLNKEVLHVPISSVVLSGQSVEMKDALYDAMKGKDEAKAVAANPLIIEGRKLVPSVTRVFTSGRELYVYLQAYEQAGGTSRPLVAYVALYRDQNKVFETQPIAVSPTSMARLASMPLYFNVSLAGLPAGRYDCQVTVIDPTDGKASFWNAEIELTPDPTHPDTTLPHTSNPNTPHSDTSHPDTSHLDSPHPVRF